MIRYFIICFYLTVATSFVRDVYALTLDIRTSPENQLDFSLVIQQSSTSLKNSVYSLQTDFSEIGIQLFDVPPTIPIQLGIAAGYVFVDQQVILGLRNTDLQGGYISFLSRFMLFEVNRWSADFTAKYNYMVAENKSETQKTRLRWNHPSIEAKLNYSLDSYLSITLGGVYGLIDARLSATGDNNMDLELKGKKRTSGILGANYHVANDQKVAIQVQRGYINRFSIHFQRTF